jgi:hypothetical protein
VGGYRGNQHGDLRSQKKLWGGGLQRWTDTNGYTDNKVISRASFLFFPNMEGSSAAVVVASYLFAKKICRSKKKKAHNNRINTVADLLKVTKHIYTDTRPTVWERCFLYGPRRDGCSAAASAPMDWLSSDHVGTPTNTHATTEYFLALKIL